MSSLNRDSVWISDLNWYTILFLHFLKTEFSQISKNLEVRQKYSAKRLIFNFLLGVCFERDLSCLMY